MKTSQTAYARCLKRPLDILLASALLFLLAPLMLLVGLFVWLSLGRPVFFADRRGGRNCRPFDCWKFRTMADLCDERGELLGDELRRTLAGDWLRATSLDELPQLWHVLTGRMSLVGPRPLSSDYLQRYTPEQNRRHEVRPGLTGWAQVNGRTSISWERKFELDAWYVEHVSFGLDMKILLLTFLRLLGVGRSAAADRPEAEFVGTKPRQT